MDMEENKEILIVYDDPCEICPQFLDCDGWDAQFCCKRCKALYGKDAPCDDCDPWDI